MYSTNRIGVMWPLGSMNVLWKDIEKYVLPSFEDLTKQNTPAPSAPKINPDIRASDGTARIGISASSSY
ncbi:hypothetical protein BGY98DRAFT_1017335 [Russula aff. rugulosa BPL654]|nr:hypothetical protein BGY98DRAFT_1017335 [Russula aff. rugulosa BPL654]